MNYMQFEMATAATLATPVTFTDAGLTDDDDLEWQEFLALGWNAKPGDLGTDGVWKHSPRSLLY